MNSFCIIVQLFLCHFACAWSDATASPDYLNFGSNDISEVRRPNFVFLLTDDQELLPDGSTYAHGMRYTATMMAEFGTTLLNFFSNSPICCPSRATLFTGKYAHNWFVPRDDACMYMDVSSPKFSDANMGMVMQRLGYTTGCFGKTLNLEIGTPYCDNGTSRPFPGWNSSFCLCNEFSFYNNIWNVNGSIEYTGSDPEDYMTSIIGNESLKFIESSLQAGSHFFAFIGVHAPHLPSTPASWYKDEFPNLKAPRPPSYNFHGLTHHYLVRNQPPLSISTQEEIDKLYRDRERSLLSVDDIMIKIIETLSNYQKLDSTYIVFTSDHGYQLGQFRLPIEKALPYDHVIRVPFFIRGPGIQAHTNMSFTASMVDLLPTLIELAGDTVSSHIDGHSFATTLLSGQTTFRQKHLVEYWSVPRQQYFSHCIDMANNTFIAVRLLNESHSFLYVEYFAHSHENSFEYPIEYELFDMATDPWQMWNLYGTPEAHVKGSLNSILNELREYLHDQVKCSGQITCS